MVTGFFEEMDDDREYPVIIVVRLQKNE